MRNAISADMNVPIVFILLQRRFRSRSFSALLAAALCVASFVPIASAEEMYEVGGKTVPRNVYDAAVNVQEANKLASAGNMERALGKLRKAVSYDPTFAPAQTNLGMLLARQGKNAEALEHMKKAIECADPPAIAYANLASLYQVTSNLDAAIATYKAFIEQSSNQQQKEQAKTTLALLDQERKRQAGQGTNEPSDYFSSSLRQGVAHWLPWRMPLKVYVTPTPSEVSGYKPHYDELLQDALYTWEKASDKKLSFRTVNSPDDCDIEVFWTNKPEELGEGAENGHTIMLSRSGAMEHARIALKAQADEGAFPFTDNTVLLTCLHEIGHALGIGWHSANPNDIMYFSIPLADNDRQISSRDKNTLVKLYSLELPIGAKIIDFILCNENRKKYAPLFFIAALFFAFLLLLLKLNSKKKKKQKS